MTAGEHGRRDYGYDDQTFSSNYPADGGRTTPPWDPGPAVPMSPGGPSAWDPDYPTSTFPGPDDPAYPPARRPVGHGGPGRSWERGRADDDLPGPGRRKRNGLPLWQELPLLLIIAFCLAVLIRTFLLQAFYIPSGSMEDTLTAGDRVLVNKVVYNFREPARGEVVVFRGTDAWAPQNTGDDDIGIFASVGRVLGDLVGISRPGEKDYIKRVIGLPGDTVSCCDVDGRVFVNGQALDEQYVVRDSPLEGDSEGAQDCSTRRFDEVVVQPGQMFVMGDHRQVSQDSRCQGPVPIENIIGRAFVIVWPSDRWGGLSAPETFASVPEPAVGLPAGSAAGSAAGMAAGMAAGIAAGPAGGQPAPVTPAGSAPALLLLLPVPPAVAARSRFAGFGPRRRLAG